MRVRIRTTTADLEERRSAVHTGDSDEVREQLVGVSRSDPVVEIGDLVEHPAEFASITVYHPEILPPAALEVPLHGQVISTVPDARSPDDAGSSTSTA